MTHSEEFDPRAAREAFEELRPRLDRLVDLREIDEDVDIEAAAAEAMVVARMLEEPEVRGRFAELPRENFKIQHVDNLGKAALATLHAVAEHRDAQDGGSESSQRTWAGYVRRAWTFLLMTYDEVSAAGRWLFRKEDPVDRFPSLLPTPQTGKSNGRHDPDVEAEMMSHLTVKVSPKKKPS